MNEVVVEELPGTGDELMVGLVATLLCVACVLFHYEVMSLVQRWVARNVRTGRVRIVTVVLAVLSAHVVEVWAFAAAYFVLDATSWAGFLDGAQGQSPTVFIYFSVSTYTTLGFGDLVPSGAMRVLTGAEALVGLGLITWSASLVFLEMQRDWARRDESER